MLAPNARAAGTTLNITAAATITGTAITWTVPYGTAVSTLAPTFTLSPLATCN